MWTPSYIWSFLNSYFGYENTIIIKKYLHIHKNDRKICLHGHILARETKRVAYCILVVGIIRGRHNFACKIECHLSHQTSQIDFLNCGYSKHFEFNIFILNFSASFCDKLSRIIWMVQNTFWWIEVVFNSLVTFIGQLYKWKFSIYKHQTSVHQSSKSNQSVQIVSIL